jgi:hypothetical protein
MNDIRDATFGSAYGKPDRTGGWCAHKAAALALLLGACAQQPASTTAPQMEADRQRLQLLEQRVEILERYIYNLPSPPVRSRKEIENNIRSLESKRSALLERYTDSHPAVREIDLSLRLLKLQLEMMDQAGKSAK